KLFLFASSAHLSANSCQAACGSASAFSVHSARAADALRVSISASVKYFRFMFLGPPILSIGIKVVRPSRRAGNVNVLDRVVSAAELLARDLVNQPTEQLEFTGDEFSLFLLAPQEGS